MTAYLVNLRDVRFLRYLLASVGALAADMGTFLLLLQSGFFAAGASGIGYCVGIVAHWLLSSRTVFTTTVAQGGSARTKQKALFAISALVGLAITIAIVGAAEASGIDARLAKIVAIVASFTATWLLRSKLVFRATV